MVQKFTLDNGATVLLDEMQDVRSLALGIFVGTGSQEERPSKQGISHFLEHVLFKRTDRRSTVQIARWKMDPRIDPRNAGFFRGGKDVIEGT